ncbi:hypothetical protein HHI36_000891, partial [Cryptolaemus montrouzieri]
IVVIMMPPYNANGEVTDEDSGYESQVCPTNLPGSQLSAPAEIYSDNRNRNFDSEDEISLEKVPRKLKGRTKERRIIIGQMTTSFPSQWPSSMS